MTKQTSLTLEGVSTLLRLDPETGQIFWLKKRGRIGADLRAGCDLYRKDKATGERKFVGRIVTIDGARYREGKLIHLLKTGDWLEAAPRKSRAIASPSEAFTGTPVEAPAEAVQAIAAVTPPPVLQFKAKAAPVVQPKRSFISNLFLKAA